MLSYVVLVFRLVLFHVLHRLEQVVLRHLFYSLDVLPERLRPCYDPLFSFTRAGYHARMARRAQHLRCSRERSERADNRLDKRAGKRGP